MKASILAIGTELTTGQIVNGNAATLSKKLNELGVSVTAHLTVPDDHQIILNALKILCSGLGNSLCGGALLNPAEDTKQDQDQLLFITGGLGPTSDDFTRDVVAKGLGLTMKFDEASWHHINERLNSRGFKVQEIQKQQCYFPENAKILNNSEGTAHAFKFVHHHKTIYVLPGPPREIEAIWKDHILADLAEKTKNINKLITKSWDTIGRNESDVAILVEEILKKAPPGASVGYRVHQPYVEVKLSYLSTETTALSSVVQDIEQTLKSITVTRDFKDIAELCFEKIKDLDFTFYDYATQGALHLRLAPYLKNVKNWSFKQSLSNFDDIPGADFFENEDDFIALLPFEKDKCIVIYSVHGIRNQKIIEAPMKSPLMIERRQQYFAEMALVQLNL